jgi:hypothetical protein
LIEPDELGPVPPDLPVAAEYHGHNYVAQVLHDVEVAHEWVLTWTDGINDWVERWVYPEVAFARLAALVRAANEDVFFVHRSDRPGELDLFADEAERFLSRTVHASSCRPGCRGDDPVNHRA